MQYGTKPLKIDHRDYDFHRTFGMTQTPTFPDNFDVDVHLWMPNQNAYDPIFNNPPQPMGCTNFVSSDLSANQDGVLYNPAYIEMYSHANANGGYDVRQSLLLTVKQGTQDITKKITYRTAVFNIKAYAPLDYFDAIRYAMLSGGTERRAVSWGTPWFKEWQVNSITDGIVPAPQSYNVDGLGWHNSEFVGFKTINGKPYLVNKSLQGDQVADHGLMYFSREIVNAVMSIPGTCAFTVTSMGSDQPIKRIETTVWEYMWSFIRNMIGLRY